MKKEELKILLFNPEQKQNELRLLIEARFLKVEHIPLIAFEPLTENLDKGIRRHREISRILFTSKNAFSFWEKALKAKGLNPQETTTGKKIAAVGKKTAERIQESGISVDLIPQRQNAEGLSTELIPLLSSEEILWIPQSNIAGTKLTETLRPHCKEIIHSIVYRTRFAEENFDRLREEIATENYLPVFTSPSSYRAFRSAGGVLNSKMVVACIGKTTEEALEEDGITPAILPEDQSYSGLAREILRFFAQ